MTTEYFPAARKIVMTDAMGVAQRTWGRGFVPPWEVALRVFDAPVELHDAISVRFDNGAIGTVAGGSAHLNAGNNKHQLEVRAIGSAGQQQPDASDQAPTR